MDSSWELKSVFKLSNSLPLSFIISAFILTNTVTRSCIYICFRVYYGSLRRHTFGSTRRLGWWILWSRLVLSPSDNLVWRLIEFLEHVWSVLVVVFTPHFYAQLLRQLTLSKLVISNSKVMAWTQTQGHMCTGLMSLFCDCIKDSICWIYSRMHLQTNEILPGYSEVLL